MSQKSILITYTASVTEAYDRLFYSLSDILDGTEQLLSLEDSGKISVFGRDSMPPKVYKDAVRAIGQCGGYCGAAGKRALTARTVELIKELAKDLDVTGEAANRLAELLIGRGINRHDRARFASPGRDASQKTKIFQENMKDIKAWKEGSEGSIEELKSEMARIRNNAAKDWYQRWRDER